jgi:hypothetical protein
MPGEKRCSFAQQDRRITAMPGLNLEHGLLREIGKEHSSLDLRLHDPTDFLIAEVPITKDGLRSMAHEHVLSSESKRV